MNDVAAALARELGPMHRALLRAARDFDVAGGLPDAQIAVLRTLRADGELTTSELASSLGLATSTISNLSKRMVQEGLIVRTPVAEDGRSTALAISERALELLGVHDAQSAELVDAALAALTDGERRALKDAIPAMRRLRALLAEATS